MGISSTLGGLHVEITAGIKGLKTNVKKAGDILKTGRKEINENAGTWAKWGTAVVAANAVAAAAIFKTTSANIKELKNLSFAANTVTEEFQRGAFAAQRFGIDQQKFGDILKDVNDRIGDFVTTGAGPMVDFFEQVAPKIGITADAFRGLSGQDGLALFVKSLEDANLSQEEMIFHMEAMASDATLLLPLFKDNAKALKEMSAEAEALGIGLSEIDVEKVSQANRELSAVSGLIGGALQIGVVELSPLVTALAKEFSFASKEAGSMANQIRSGFDTAVNAAGFFLDAVEGVKRTFEVLGSFIAVSALGWKLIFHKIGNSFWEGLGEKVEAFIELWNDLPFTDDIKFTAFDGVVAQTQADMDATELAIQMGMDSIAEILARPMPSEGLKKSVADARAASEELAQIAEVNRMAQEAVDFISVDKVKSPELVDASSGTQALMDRFSTEEELQKSKFKRDQRQLDEALSKKEISAQTHNELMLALEKDHAEKINLIKIQAPKLLEVSNSTQNLMDRFATEEQLQADKYDSDQKQLDIALAKKEVSEKTHKELMLALEKENIQALKDLRLGATEEETAARLEALQARFATETELENQKFALDQETLTNALAQEQLTKDEFNLLEQERDQEHRETIADIDRQAALTQLSNTAGILGKLQTLSAAGGKKHEKTTRALAVTVAAMQGIAAAISSYKAGADIGGPPVGALYAAASIATTAAMISKLKSGSKSASRPSGKVRSASGSSSESGSSSQSRGSQAQATQAKRFDITLVGSTFNADTVRELMGQISEQVGDGVEFNVS